ncbi:hypothetical protein QYM36_013390 [Artemia franciscana]|uniref:Anoctamin n=1 Tax=Artemia franciscana TaxID=6661 RepID=A0AA88HI82_ARTSF|nr:hypothetical protein QYM36_013390 [Artemia franciscana]
MENQEYGTCDSTRPCCHSCHVKGLKADGHFGFCTVFVTALPWATLIFITSNVINIRLEVKKFLKRYQRPVAHIVKGIGVLGDVMDLIGKVSIRTNFGFCTVFVTALPLATLIFFISNVINIRLEVKKFLKRYQRPVAHTMKGIGVLGDSVVALIVWLVDYTKPAIPRQARYETERTSWRRFVEWFCPPEMDV